MPDEDYKIPEPDHYTFVFEDDSNGWWLKIDTLDKLADYMMKTESMYSNCLAEYIRYKADCLDTQYDKGQLYSELNNRTKAIIMFAEKRHLTMIDATIQFKMYVFTQMSNAIKESGYIVINKVGGYHSGPVKYSQFTNRKTFTWPDFKEKDIRITQFPGGTHYYVHIGEMELHENDEIKWNTHEEAMAAAKRYIGKENRNDN
jgi:hypothetical protein